ncbi:MAG TPA: hypothetical protein VKA15_08300 [Isosphaeraceae bacterium]|nr:hypothetical protein [Isosphaeraceae bacterium]
MTIAAGLEKDNLTCPQRRVYEFMVRFQKKHGLPPTLREICIALKLASPNGAREHAMALVCKGKAKTYRRGTWIYYVAIAPKD